MNTPTQEHRQKLIFKIAMMSIAVSFILVLAAIGFEAYIRYYKNQNFTVLGGFELEALTLSAFALVLGLSYLYRTKENQPDSTPTL